MLTAEITLFGSVRLSWGVPTGTTEIRLLHRLRANSTNTQDGVTLLSRTAPPLPLPTEYVDTTPVTQKINYYTLFVKDAGGLWSREEVRISIWDWYGWVDILYERLPELYRVADFVSDDEELLFGWGLDEWGPSPYGAPLPSGAINKPLFRFLMIVGMELEKLRFMYESMSLHKDPFEIDDTWLEALAWDIGWVLNKELPVLRQRVEVANAVFLYKRKGTAVGLEAMIRALINWDVEIIDPKYNILFRNRHRGLDARYDSTRVDTVDPTVKQLMGTARDTVDYRLGPVHRPDVIQIILTAEQDFEVFHRIIEKLLRILQEWLPICISAVLTLRTLNEDGATLGESRPDDADLLVQNWLLRNSQPTVPNPNSNQLLERRVRNSLLWRRPLS